MFGALINTKKKYALKEDENLFLKNDTQIRRLVNRLDVYNFTEVEIEKLNELHILAEKLEVANKLFLPPEVVYFDVPTTISMLVEAVKDMEELGQGINELRLEVLEILKKYKITR